MVNAETLSQVKAFARQDALFLAVVWFASMWALVENPERSLGTILMLCTPFVVGWRLRVFRDRILGGLISFRRALCYSCYVFLYTSLLFALGQFLYFKFLDHGKFLAIVQHTIETMRPVYEQNGLGVDQLDMAQKVIGMMSPIQMVMTFMMQNLMVGLVLSLLIALVCKRTKL